MNKQKRAFTMLELLVGLMVLAITMAAGVYGFLSYRASTTMQTALSDIVSYINTRENEALNSISSQKKAQNTNDAADSLPDYYAIIFNNNNYSEYYCDSGVSRLNCFLESQNVKRINDSSIKIETDCDGIAFKRLTGDLVKIDSETGNFVSDGNCIITLRSDYLTYTKKISIDFTKNIINVD